MKFTFLTTEEACELLKCQSDTLTKLRGNWIDGVHFVKRGQGPTAPVLYVEEMMLDWLINQSSPEAHQRAIEYFRKSLPSGQKRTKRKN